MQSKVRFQKTRSGCKDVFNAFLVQNANYVGKLEIPIINGSIDIPNKIISFVDAKRTKDFNQWVHFYIDDFHFDRLWNKIDKYIDLFKKFNGVILPDFSLYRDMPLVMQYWNIYRSRAIGRYLEDNGVKVIVNIRYGDERTHECCCLGVPHNSVVAVGTHGSVKNKLDRYYLDKGFEYIIKKIKPKSVVIYGPITEKIQKICAVKKINIINFRSEQYKKLGGK